MQFHNRIAYHDYQSIALDLDGRQRIQADLGDRRVLILRNHGLLTADRSVGEAFILMHNLERSCKVQLALMASGGTPIPIGEDVVEKTAAGEYQMRE